MMDFKLKKLDFNNAPNVEINFLLWVDTLQIEKLNKLPHEYNNLKIKYDLEAIEVLEVIKNSFENIISWEFNYNEY